MFAIQNDKCYKHKCGHKFQKKNLSTSKVGSVVKACRAFTYGKFVLHRTHVVTLLSGNHVTRSLFFVPFKFGVFFKTLMETHPNSHYTTTAVIIDNDTGPGL